MHHEQVKEDPRQLWLELIVIFLVEGVDEKADRVGSDGLRYRISPGSRGEGYFIIELGE